MFVALIAATAASLAPRGPLVKHAIDDGIPPRRPERPDARRRLFIVSALLVWAGTAANDLPS